MRACPEYAGSLHVLACIRSSRSALALGFGAIVAACAAQVTDPVSDDPGGFGDTKRSCDAAGNTIVVVSDAGDIYRFSPATRAFERLSHAACLPAGQTVWAAAVDRRGVAWLSLNGGADDAGAFVSQLHPVQIVDGTCGAPVAYDADAFAGRELTAGTTPGILYGIRIVATQGGPGAATQVSTKLVTLDTTTAPAKVTASSEVGPISMFAAPIDAAITQASDGKIAGFFNALNETAHVRPYLVSIDAANGALVSTPGTFPHIETRNLSTNAPDPPAALVIWGGERWVFAGDPATRPTGYTAVGSMLVRVPGDGAESEVVKSQMSFLVVGAGSVPCAGGPPLR